MSTTSYPKNAFTLLELLVVVAVIALLLAILLPALTAARQAGEATVCGTQLYQLAQGSLTYSQDNDDYMPFYGSTRRLEGDSEWWVTQVAQVMDQFEPGIYRCPGDALPYAVPVYLYQGSAYLNSDNSDSWDTGSSMSNAPNERPKRAEHAGGRTIMLPVSYRGACDQQISVLQDPARPEDREAWSWHSRRITDFANPSRAFQMTEGHNSTQFEVTRVNQWECFYSEMLTNIDSARFDSWYRHFGLSNLSFVDGHVERVIPAEAAQIILGWRSHVLSHAREDEFR